MESVFLNIIRPALEYCCVIYDNCSVSDSDLLDSVQRKAALLCTGAIKRTPTSILMNEVGWDTLVLRRRVFKLTLFFKIVNNRAPSYLSSNVAYNASTVSTRSAARSLRILEIKCRTDRYFNSYFPSRIGDWNNLSDDWCNMSPDIVKNKFFELWRTETNLPSVSVE